MSWPIPEHKYYCYYCKYAMSSTQFFLCKGLHNYNGRIFCSNECRDTWIEQEYDDGRYGDEPMEDFI